MDSTLLSAVSIVTLFIYIKNTNKRTENNAFFDMSLYPFMDIFFFL